jgi:paraquat-inducible protein A
MTSGDEIPAGSDDQLTSRAMSVLACPECDLLQRTIPLAGGGTARCSRCGALLYRNIPHSLDRTVALLLAAAVLFIIANANPIVALEAQGIRNTTTMLGAVRVLLNQDMATVSLLVFSTAVLAPAVEIAAMLYLLLPLRRGHVPAGFAVILRVVLETKHWNMVEVFMLALLVSLVKLSKFADVVPGLALWTYAVFTFLMTTAWTFFDPHELWECVEKADGKEAMS